MMKRIAIPAVSAAALLFTAALVTMPPSNVQGGQAVPGVILTLKCFYVDNNNDDRTDKTVDKSIQARLVFYFTDEGDPLTDTLTVLTCDRDNPVDTSVFIPAVVCPNGCTLADDFHKNIKIYRGGEEDGAGEPWRLVWACHHEGEFDDSEELEDLLEDNKCRYKDNHVTVQAKVFECC
jgi:hypothetical protein